MELLALKGQHHVSAVTANAARNYEFYTKVLGLRLVKKSVNQDETSMYHLFYADERGNPGTDLTFFEIPHAGPTYAGTNSISLTSLRVGSDEAIRYWKSRFADFNVDHDDIAVIAGRDVLSFRDFEGQRLMLISDEHNTGVAGGVPWDRSPVPAAYGIIGLGPVVLTVAKADLTANVLMNVMGYKEIEGYAAEKNGNRHIRVFTTGEGGTGAEIYLDEVSDLPRERSGRGSVHHVAFRVESEEELHKWVKRISESGLSNSGFVERFYFRSLYFREPNGILFELATDGPGFESDEAFEHLGEKLALPPYFENQRASIEAKLKPLVTEEQGDKEDEQV
jgi:glyoxalase family protein